MIRYDESARADLAIDAVYEGRIVEEFSDEAIFRLIPGVGHQGCFHAAGKGDEKDFVVLCTRDEDTDWPDKIDLHSGRPL